MQASTLAVNDIFLRGSSVISLANFPMSLGCFDKCLFYVIPKINSSSKFLSLLSSIRVVLRSWRLSA